MKSISLLILAAVLLFAGCGKKASYLKADADRIQLSREGGTDSLVLHSDANNFQLLSSPDWAKVELADSVLCISAQQNPGNTPRKGSIVVANDEQKLSIQLTQSSPASYLTLESNSVTIPQDGSAVTVKVDTDGSDVKIAGIDNVTSTYKDGVDDYR